MGGIQYHGTPVLSLLCLAHLNIAVLCLCHVQQVFCSLVSAVGAGSLRVKIHRIVVFYLSKVFRNFC